jgi:hypothetical protein
LTGLSRFRLSQDDELGHVSPFDEHCPTLADADARQAAILFDQQHKKPVAFQGAVNGPFEFAGCSPVLRLLDDLRVKLLIASPDGP